MTVLDWLDDDDIITLNRYQPLTNRGIDRILRRLKAAINHPTNPRHTTTLTIEIPTHIIHYMAALDPAIYNERGSNTGAILAAVTRAARGHHG